MKDVHAPLRKLLVTTMGSEGLTVYENGAVPDGAVAPYVLISTTNATEDSNKSDFGHDVNISLDVVTEYQRNVVGGSLKADQMAGQILAKINSKTYPELEEGLEIVNIKLTNDQKLNDTYPTKRVYRRFLTYKLLIMEV